jgi:very-short-patch-repair endonuclease
MLTKNLVIRRNLQSFRSSLRNKSTSVEAALWNILISRKLDGRKFMRLYIIDKYIVDFCSPTEKLVIELEGAPHREYHNILKKEMRNQNTNQPPRPEIKVVYD